MTAITKKSQKTSRTSRSKKEPDVVIDCHITPETLDWCLKNDLMIPETIYRFTPKGLKMLKEGLAAEDKIRSIRNKKSRKPS